LHRLVVRVVPGKRTAEKVESLVEDFKQRTGGRPMNLITSDAYKPYRGAILKAYGEQVVPEPTGKPGRPKTPYYKPAPKWKYAAVHKTREKGRVVKIDFRVVFGTVAGAMAALKRSRVSNKINAAFVERQNSGCLLHAVRAQLLRAGAYAPATRPRRSMAAADSRHGRRFGQSRLVPLGVVDLSGSATRIGHQATKERGHN
jgi:hypothetical protein